MNHRYCNDPAHGDTSSRRDFLKVGVLGGLGLTLGNYFKLRSAAADEGGPAPKAQSVILIYLSGGMSHIDTFDPKPLAPIEYRGELGVVNTNVAGIQFGGLFPKTAQVADKLAVIRSMTHGEAAHERGQHNMLTGYKPSPAIVYPSMGSVVSHEYGPRKNLPAYICVPSADNPFMGSGYLSSAYGPFSVGNEPVNANFEVRDLNLPGGVDPTRMDKRRGLLAAVDEHFTKLESADTLTAMDSFYQRAYALISSQEAREAFNIKAEKDAIRDEYGRTAIGQRMLLARRLVEGGARFVTVIDGGYDFHQNIKGSMQNQVPPLDQAYSTLIRDLDRRGLLKTTIVVLTTEFGRTAKLNRDGGRDHWPKVFSVVLAGGGIPGGQAVGSSNTYAQEPETNPVEPPDVAAAIFTNLGIPPTRKLISPGGRPIDISRQFKAIKELA